LNASEAECVNYRFWCLKRFYLSESRCQDEFFNKALNRNNLPIHNPVIGSNTTIDGRQSNAYFRFNGFAIGRDSGGAPSRTASSVIVTHLDFRGVGHVENHALDPDMIRSTGASRDIWIHKNDFESTGDSAFDVKVGAHNITISFNRLVDVKRAGLHGSNDGQTINGQITTTMHHNPFVTRDRQYEEFAKDARWVPLIRRGKSHMFNNVFVNYRKDVLSVREDGAILWQDNMFVVNESRRLKNALPAELKEMRDILITDIQPGNFRGEGVHLWAADGACNLDDAHRREITAAHGMVADLSRDYLQASRDVINAQQIEAGQELMDYVSATAGRAGQMPFNSPLAGDRHYVLGLGRVPCQ
jgi:pectate lyase